MEHDINILIENNMGLVYMQMHKLKLADDPEALSLGMEALHSAIVNFDPGRGTKLSTMATVYIFNALAGYIRTLNKKRQIYATSYNCKVGDENEVELVELIPGDCNVEESILRKELDSLTMQAFSTLYKQLSNETHKRIIIAWYESDFKATTVDIANEVGTSQSYVSRTLSNFKAALRKQLKEYYYA